MQTFCDADEGSGRLSFSQLEGGTCDSEWWDMMGMGIGMGKVPI